MSGSGALKAAYFHDEDAAYRYVESLRWPDGPVCPHCHTPGDHYRLQGESHRRHLLKCHDCRRQFSVTVGTVMQGSRVPLSKWLTAAALLCCGRRPISISGLHGVLGITYKSAWHLAHDIRRSLRAPPRAGRRVSARARRPAH